MKHLILFLALVASALAGDVSGQCFITTQGGKTVKMSGVIVWIFPVEVKGRFDTYSSRIDLPAPVAKCSTNADGVFSAKPPGEGPWLLVAQGGRLIGRNWERYEWVVETAGTQDLNNSNLSRTVHELHADGA